MSKKSLLFLSVLLTVFGLILLKPNSCNNKAIESITSLTKLPGIAISTPYLQNRIIYYKDHSDKIYPDMKSYSKTSFVYAK